MGRRVEEGSRSERSAALAHQAFDERAGIGDAPDTRKDDRPGRRRPLQIGARLQEGVGERFVPREDRARARREGVEVRESERRQPLGDNRAGAVDDVAGAPDAIGQRGDAIPTRAKAREPV